MGFHQTSSNFCWCYLLPGFHITIDICAFEFEFRHPITSRQVFVLIVVLGFRSTSAAGVLGQLEPALLSVFKLRFRVSNSSLAKPSRLSHLPLNSGPSFRKQVFHKTKLMVSDMRDIPQCLTSRLSHNTFATAFEDLLADHGATYSLDSLKSA